ncbi:hypothetical protein QQF64_004255 [Cirrhinus molitorella]|uniref:Uncharacterized protein n=1 Tax=Cirrhinus molitorella TaxID=172907 RepID=A0ABR3MFN9_9TELE
MFFPCVCHVYTPLVISSSCDIRKLSAPCCSGVTCERWTRASLTYTPTAAGVTMEALRSPAACRQMQDSSIHSSIHPLLVLLIPTLCVHESETELLLYSYAFVPSGETLLVKGLTESKPLCKGIVHPSEIFLPTFVTVVAGI